VWDAAEAVGYEVARRGVRPADPSAPPGVYPSAAANQPDVIPWARFRASNRKEQMASGGVYTAEDKACLFPQAVLTPGLVPKVRDVVIDLDDGSRWTVLEANLGKLDQTWKLMTRNLALAHDLVDRVDVQRAAVSYDRGGYLLKAWPPAGGTTPYRQIPARVQLVADQVVDQAGIRGFLGTHQCFVDRELADVTNEDRVLFQGRYYEVRGYRQSEAVDQLPYLELELVP
jgi:head-tail adaptor